MKKIYTIEDLSEGKVMVSIKGIQDKDKLKEVLKAAFPKDKSNVFCNSDHYKATPCKRMWMGTEANSMCNIQSVDVFYRQLNKEFIETNPYRMAVHCKTRDQFNSVLKYHDSLGREWAAFLSSNLSSNAWDIYKEDTALSLSYNSYFSSCDLIKTEGTRILSFKEFEVLFLHKEEREKENKEPSEPKLGTWVEVSNDNKEWFKRIYLNEIPYRDRKICCVCNSGIKNFLERVNYDIEYWKYKRVIEEEKLLEIPIKEIAEIYNTVPEKIKIV